MDDAVEVWPVAERIAEQASVAGVDLLVFPEVTYPAYWLESAERYRQPDIERTEAVLKRFSELAEQHAFWLVAGFVEESNDLLYNSAAVFDRRGKLIATARKQFMWDCDRQWFTPGNGSTVVATEFGRMGLQICADMRMPEISATLVCEGAQFMVQPTAWVNTSQVRRTYRNIQPDFLIRARAMEFGLPFICCSKSGRESYSMEYVGQSQIVSSEGEVLDGAEVGGDALVVAEISATRAKTFTLDHPIVERLLSTKPPVVNEQFDRTCKVNLRQDADAIAAALEENGARVARLAAHDLNHFAAARCHALDGIQIVVARGRLTDDAPARARAAENCMFVIVASDGGGQFVFDPRGSIIWRKVDKSDAIELDVRLAEVKAFTPTTDIWSQRRVETYRLT